MSVNDATSNFVSRWDETVGKDANLIFEFSSFIEENLGKENLKELILELDGKFKDLKKRALEIITIHKNEANEKLRKEFVISTGEAASFLKIKQKINMLKEMTY